MKVGKLPTKTDNAFWDMLASAEADIVGKDSQADMRLLAALPLAFFVHRSILTTTAALRSHALWRRGKKVNSLDPASLLVNIYLEHHGPLGTFTNLILEAEAISQTSNRHSVVVLDLSAEMPKSSWSEANGILTITVSNDLLHRIGIKEKCWNALDEIVNTIKPTSEMAQIKDVIVRCRKKLQQLDVHQSLDSVSLFNLWPSEGELFKRLVEYSNGCALNQLRDETVLSTVKMWLQAIRATFVFQRFGRVWYTAPIESPLAEIVEREFKPPLSSWSAIAKSRSLDIVASLQKFIKERKVSHDLNRELMRSVFNHVKPGNSEEESAIGPQRELPRLMYMKNLAESLIGSDHEGKQLLFNFICCNDREFLRWYVSSIAEAPTRKRWGIRIRQTLSSTDFGGGVTKQEDAIEQVKKVIQGNSLILQHPGVFLWFSPVAGIHAEPDSLIHPIAHYTPNAIVELVGDRMDHEDSFLLLSKTLPLSALISVDGRQASLFENGQRTFICKGGKSPERGRWIDTTQQPLLTEALLKVLSKMKCGHATPEDVSERARKVMAAAEEIARQRHGALFFLWNGKPKNQTTPLSLAWGWASNNNYLELTDVMSLASAAALDGETVVNLETGHYQVRQFTHPTTPKQTMSFINDKTGSIEPVLLEHWKSSPTAIDEAVDLWNFGTRHQKALRVTWMLPKNVVAVTVSASGPIRIWQNGKPIYKGNF